MSSLITPQKTDRGWVIEIPADMAQALGVAEGSLAVMHIEEGGLQVEVLPLPSPDLKVSVRRIQEKYKDAFAEMKRLGD
jgi:hypothetical protein